MKMIAKFNAYSTMYEIKDIFAGPFIFDIDGNVVAFDFDKSTVKQYDDSDECCFESVSALRILSSENKDCNIEVTPEYLASASKIVDFDVQYSSWNFDGTLKIDVSQGSIMRLISIEFVEEDMQNNTPQKHYNVPEEVVLQYNALCITKVKKILTQMVNEEYKEFLLEIGDDYYGREDEIRIYQKITSYISKNGWKRFTNDELYNLFAMNDTMKGNLLSNFFDFWSNREDINVDTPRNVHNLISAAAKSFFEDEEYEDSEYAEYSDTPQINRKKLRRISKKDISESAKAKIEESKRILIQSVNREYEKILSEVSDDFELRFYKKVITYINESGCNSFSDDVLNNLVALVSSHNNLLHTMFEVWGSRPDLEVKTPKGIYFVIRCAADRIEKIHFSLLNGNEREDDDECNYVRSDYFDEYEEYYEEK